jgi:PKD repeat protein
MRHNKYLVLLFGLTIIIAACKDLDKPEPITPVTTNDTIAKFNVDKTTCVAPCTVQFTNESTGSGTLKYDWAFGDTGKSTDTSPSHEYKSAGIYSVTLTATGNNGAKTATKEITIAPAGNKPMAAFDFSYSNNATAPSVVTFVNKSMNATKFIWTFDDNSTPENGNSPSHEYKEPGKYKVKLIAENTTGDKNEIEKEIIIKPLACFTMNCGACTSPAAVGFNGACSTSGVTYNWAFGVTSTVSTNIVNPSNVIYSSAGKYNVKLTVSKNGVTDTITMVLDIKTPAPPVAAFSYTLCNTDFPTACDIVFTDKSTGTISKRTWDFGDPNSGVSNTSSSTNPSHKYSVAGTYIVKLTVEGPGGISTSTPQTLTLKAKTFERTLTTVNEKGSSIIQTIDGGYFYTTITGKGIGYGKLDKNGALTWNGFYDEGKSLPNSILRTRGVETSDKGYIIAGTVASSINNGKVVVIKLDANGAIVWNKELGSYSNMDNLNLDYFYDLIKTSTNSYTVYMYDGLGTKATDQFTYRTVTVSESGILNYSIYSNEGNPFSPIANIFQASDGNLVLSSVNRFVHKYSGKTLAVKNETLPNETINSICQSSKGSILALTSSKVHKLTLGSLVLENTIANHGGNCIIKNSQNDLVICGNEAVRVVEKVDNDFNSKWITTASQLNKTGVDFSFIRETTDGGYILIGTLTNKTYILKIGADGKL